MQHACMNERMHACMYICMNECVCMCTHVAEAIIHFLARMASERLCDLPVCIM